MNAVLVLIDTNGPRHIYKFILVNKDELSKAKEVAHSTYLDVNCASSDVFESIFKALDKAGIFYRRIEDWCTCLF